MGDEEQDEKRHTKCRELRSESASRWTIPWYNSLPALELGKAEIEGKKLEVLANGEVESGHEPGSGGEKSKILRSLPDVCTVALLPE